MAKGFDCATKLTKTAAVLLKKTGFEYVARYLGDSWKTFDKAEAEAIVAAGLKLVSIFEKNSTYPEYFSKARGISDAKEAMKLAKEVGQPVGTAIYFTVDYNAQPSHMDKIKAYLQGVKETIKDYKVGLYGSYSVMMAAKGLVDYYWQTYAWSKGQVADHIHKHQYKNGDTVAGVHLDWNDIKKIPGAWNDIVEKAPKEEIPPYVPTNNGVIARVKVLVDDLNIRVAPDTKAAISRKAKKGEVFNVFANVNDWHNVGQANWIFGNNGKYLALVKEEPKPQYPGQPIKNGSTNTLAIKEIQKEVGVTSDGVWGPKTDAAVKAWQKKHGLTADGIVGPKTWDKMF